MKYSRRLPTVTVPAPRPSTLLEDLLVQLESDEQRVLESCPNTFRLAEKATAQMRTPVADMPRDKLDYWRVVYSVSDPVVRGASLSDILHPMMQVDGPAQNTINTPFGVGIPIRQDRLGGLLAWPFVNPGLWAEFVPALEHLVSKGALQDPISTEDIERRVDGLHRTLADYDCVQELAALARRAGLPADIVTATQSISDESDAQDIVAGLDDSDEMCALIGWWIFSTAFIKGLACASVCLRRAMVRRREMATWETAVIQKMNNDSSLPERAMLGRQAIYSVLAHTDARYRQRSHGRPTRLTAVIERLIRLYQIHLEIRLESFRFLIHKGLLSPLPMEPEAGLRARVLAKYKPTVSTSVPDFPERFIEPFLLDLLREGLFQAKIWQSMMSAPIADELLSAPRSVDTVEEALRLCDSAHVEKAAALLERELCVLCFPKWCSAPKTREEARLTYHACPTGWLLVGAIGGLVRTTGLIYMLRFLRQTDLRPDRSLGLWAKRINERSFDGLKFGNSNDEAQLLQRKLLARLPPHRRKHTARLLPAISRCVTTAQQVGYAFGRDLLMHEWTRAARDILGEILGVKFSVQYPSKAHK